MLHHMSGTWLDLEKAVFHHRLDRDAFPYGIKFAPARDTVDIHLNFCAREFVEVIPCPLFFLVHLAPHAKIPCGGIEVWYRAIMQNWKFKRKCLAGWQASLGTHPFFLLTAIGSF